MSVISLQALVFGTYIFPSYTHSTIRKWPSGTYVHAGLLGETTLKRRGTTYLLALDRLISNAFNIPFRTEAADRPCFRSTVALLCRINDVTRREEWHPPSVAVYHKLHMQPYFCFSQPELCWRQTEQLLWKEALSPCWTERLSKAMQREFICTALLLHFALFRKNIGVC